MCHRNYISWPGWIYIVQEIRKSTMNLVYFFSDFKICNDYLTFWFGLIIWFNSWAFKSHTFFDTYEILDKWWTWIPELWHIVFVPIKGLSQIKHSTGIGEILKLGGERGMMCKISQLICIIGCFLTRYFHEVILFFQIFDG